MASIQKKYTLLFVSLVVVLFCLYKYRWADNKYKEIISGDGAGYYSYLPAIFINKNLGQQPSSENNNTCNNHQVIKYTCGTAVLQSPFFFAGYLVAFCFNYPLDGFSEPFQKTISFAALFYLLIGCWAIYKTLLLNGISKNIALISLFVFIFGSNLFYYAIIEPSRSHIYSFFTISCLIYFISNLNNRNIFFATLFFALTILVRPVNGIVLLLIPLLADKTKISSLRFNFKMIAVNAVIIFGILFIQFALWYIQTGRFVVWSYSNEGFYFLNPQWLEVLFGFRKGLFIYTPLTFISLGGLVFIFNKNKTQFTSGIVFFIILIYITSSWWCWSYGDSFGLRPIVDFYGFFMLLFSILLSHLTKTLRWIVYALSICCISLNFTQQHQYINEIISRFDMNFEKYKFTFLKISDRYKNTLGGYSDIQPYTKDSLVLFFESKNQYEKTSEPYWNTLAINKEKNENGFCLYTANDEYKTTLTLHLDSLIEPEKKILALLKLKYLEHEMNAGSKASLAIDISNGNTHDFYLNFYLSDAPNNTSINTWKEQTYSIVIPPRKNKNNSCKIYIWNRNRNEIGIDDFEVKLFTISSLQP